MNYFWQNPGRFHVPREGYLRPHLRGTPPFVPPGTDLAIWSWDEGGVPHAIAFQGKADKPLWHFRFSTPEQREKRIEVTVQSRLASLGHKQERRAVRQAFQHSLKVGDILYSSWGYDQTNVDFYKVVEVKDKSVVICKISKSVAREEEGADYVVPAGGCAGERMLKLVKEGNAVKLTSFSSARPWEGKPMYETALGWGH